MSIPIKIDFVSDVACPWCAVGLKSLEAAIARVGSELNVEPISSLLNSIRRCPPKGRTRWNT